jgi:predicted DNA-binding transcriptional regulator AlpA
MNMADRTNRPMSQEVKREMSQQLLTPEQLAKMAQVTIGTLAALRSSGKGPHYLRLNGKCVRYALADVEAWLQSIRERDPNGNSKAEREMALPVSMARPIVFRNNRLGGHRTKSESREGIRSERASQVEGGIAANSADFVS